MRDIVLLSTAEWENPFWTNKQHVTIELEKLGYRVFYIDSLGLRKASVKSSDLKRILNRIKKAFMKPKKVNEGIFVWSPLPLPFQRFILIKKLNTFLLNLQLNIWLKLFNFKKDIFWTYSPLTLKVFDTSKYNQLIYHCVDDIKSQPGMPVDEITNAEKDLLLNSDIVFTTSRTLEKNSLEYNKNTYYFSNVVDFRHFTKANFDETIIPDDIKNISNPIIGFIGAISGYKLNFDLIEFIVSSRPNYSYVFIGKVGEGDPWTDISKLKKYKNVIFLGPKNYNELPQYLKAMDVTILPNDLNEYTKSMFPMKFFEYLAAGKPVVSVKLDALREFYHIGFFSDDFEEFLENIDTCVLSLDRSFIEKCIDVSKDFTYEKRMKKMINIVKEKYEKSTDT